MDPRVKTTFIGLRKKFDLEVCLASAVTRSSDSVSQARSVQEQLKDLAPKQTSTADSAKKVLSRVTAVLDGANEDSDRPTLKEVNNHAIDLYKEVERSDAEPTAAQVSATHVLERQLNVVAGQWNEIKVRDLTPLNLRLPASNLPHVRLDIAPREEETGENEE
jgi:hypothetical protein